MLVTGRDQIRERLAVVLGATTLAAALTYPLVTGLDRLGRLNTDDGRWSLWIVAWVAQALTTAPWTVFDANIFHPLQGTLAFSEPNLVAGAIGAPVWALTHNPYTTYNVVLLATFVFAFAATYALTKYLTGDRGAAVIAAILFAFCPYVYARTAHVQLLFTAGLPLTMLAFHRLVDHPTVGRAVALGVALWTTALACGYYGIFAALMVTVGTLVFAGSRSRWRSADYWIGLGLAVFVAGGLTLPFFQPFLILQRETGFARTLDEAGRYSANWGAWAASNAWAHRWWLPELGTFNETLFPGIVTTVGGLAASWWALRSWQSARAQAHGAPRTTATHREVYLLYLLIGVLGFWLSFGPVAGLYGWLYNSLGVLSLIRAPARMGLMVTFALVVLTASPLAALLQSVRRPLVVTGLIAAIAIADVATMPLTQFREAPPAAFAYRVLATLPRGPVAEFPYWNARPAFPRHASYMLNSTLHWQRLINGYSDHIPESFREQVLQLGSFPSTEAFAALAISEARYAVVHLDDYDNEARDHLIERLDAYSAYLKPLVRQERVWLYEIVDFPESEP
ncbi:MAG: hypothetical protein H0T71_15125 [Acidobacteria bacterium]|nr:hypothetical protein [Acidobacteriota bacterium]